MPSTRCCTTMRGAGADALTLPEYAHRPSLNRPECATLGGRIEGADRAIAAAARWEIRCMLLPLDGRRLYYDLAGPESGPVVGFTHSLSSDSGMWAEQVPALLAAGFRVLRIDMRGHGGSDPVAGDYAMDQLAADVAAVIEALGIAQLHYIGLSIGGMIGQAFAINHGVKLNSLMLCDTSPGSPPDAKETWTPRIAAVTKANSLAPLADGTIHPSSTDASHPATPAP